MIDFFLQWLIIFCLLTASGIVLIWAYFRFQLRAKLLFEGAMQDLNDLSDLTDLPAFEADEDEEEEKENVTN